MTPPNAIKAHAIFTRLLLAAALLAVGGAVTWLGSRPAASAQSAPPAGHGQDAIKVELRPLVDQYLSLFSQGKIDEMLQRMPLPSGGNRDDFENLRRALAALYSAAGRYSGFDVVGFQHLSPRYIEVYVIAYFDKEPAVFQFGFYRPNSDWQVQHFKLRSDFSQFLDLLPVQRS